MDSVKEQKNYTKIKIITKKKTKTNIILNQILYGRKKKGIFIISFFFFSFHPSLIMKCVFFVIKKKMTKLFFCLNGPTAKMKVGTFLISPILNYQSD